MHKMRSRSIAVKTSNQWALLRPDTPNTTCGGGLCFAPPQPVQVPQTC